MKTLVLSIIVIITASVSNAQIVNIPDANFKNALIVAGVDTSGDGEISYAEAEKITNLDVSDRNISDLTGIEAFIHLDTLFCWLNQLTNLDVSNNTALTNLECWWNQLTSQDVSNNTALLSLSCGSNQLTSLDVSNNTALLSLSCDGNQLTSLDVSNNTALFSLNCGGNQLTSLDVSGCTALRELYCGYNQLTSLDVSNNTALTHLLCGGNQLSSLDISSCYPDFQANSKKFKGGPIELDISNMPSLYEVCVWVLPFPPDDFYMDTTGSPNVYFTTDCSVNSSDNYRKNSPIDIYPNPATDQLTVEFNNVASQVTSIILYDITGKLVYSENPVQTVSSTHTINLSSLREGLYFLHISNDQYLSTEKVIKVE